LKESTDFNNNKGFRLLSMYERLNKGELLRKEALARDFGVTAKTVQRDIVDLRAYLADTHMFEQEAAVKYDKARNGYFLVKFEREWLTNREALGLCKILLESRAFCKPELDRLAMKLLMQITPEEKPVAERIIRSELLNYVPPRHGKALLARVWELSQFIFDREIITFNYVRQDGASRVHRVKPVAVMFSEFYFYLIAYMADGDKPDPTVFRADRIDKPRGCDETFNIPYEKKFSEGEFRKRVQFMYPGELRDIRFAYSGPSVESVLDRLPTAGILSEKDGVYEIKAEVYGVGVDMWLRSQGDAVRLIEP
jgi:predicted DNA-binding transcriptional regulator YafY